MNALAMIVDNSTQQNRARNIASALSAHAAFIKPGLSTSARVHLNSIIGAMTQIADGSATFVSARINDSILALLPEVEKMTSIEMLGKHKDAQCNPRHQDMRDRLARTKPEMLAVLEEIPLYFIGYDA